MEGGSVCSFPLLALTEVRVLTGIRAYFFGVLAYTEGQNSQPCGPDNHWMLGLSAEIAGPQSVGHSNNPVFTLIDSFCQFCFSREL